MPYTIQYWGWQYRVKANVVAGDLSFVKMELGEELLGTGGGGLGRH